MLCVQLASVRCEMRSFITLSSFEVKSNDVAIFDLSYLDKIKLFLLLHDTLVVRYFQIQETLGITLNCVLHPFRMPYLGCGSDDPLPYNLF